MLWQKTRCGGKEASDFHLFPVHTLPRKPTPSVYDAEAGLIAQMVNFVVARPVSAISAFRFMTGPSNRDWIICHRCQRVGVWRGRIFGSLLILAICTVWLLQYVKVIR